MHFHAPSEHTIDGEYFDAELHFVHNRSATEFIVIGVLFDVTGKDTKEGMIIEELNLEDLEHDTDKYFVEQINLEKFFSHIKNKQFFHYPGSLTTPGCAEIVEWLLIKQPLQISPKDFDYLWTHIGSSNRVI